MSELARRLQHATFIALWLLLAGCSQFMQQNEYTVRLSQILGSVTVEGPEAPIKASVMIGQKSLTAERGAFRYSPKPGVYPYHVVTPLGEVAGTVAFDGREDVILDIKIPLKYGWDADTYNQLFIGSQHGGTMRWSSERVVNVWIDPALGVQAALSSIYDQWASALKGLLEFEFVQNKDDAELLFEKEESGWGYEYSLERGYISRYEFRINPSMAGDNNELWGLSARSLGFVNPPSRPPNAGEQEMLLLTYLLPTGTPAF